MSSSPNPPPSKPLKPLSTAQERRLVEYLDNRLLDITRNFKKRSEPTSTLRTLAAYLEATRRVLALILQIPPADPSTSLRIAYLLRLTGDVISAIPGYRLRPVVQAENGHGDGGDEPRPENVENVPLPWTAEVQEALQDLLDFLDDLDEAWMTVLQGEVWRPDGTSTTPPPGTKSTKPTQTDRTRLRSLLFSGQSNLEEWLTNEQAGTTSSSSSHHHPQSQPQPQLRPDDDDDDDDEVNSNDVKATGDSKAQEDISIMLSRMGLLDKFDSLFAKTIDHLGGFSQTAVNMAEEAVMEAGPAGSGACG